MENIKIVIDRALPSPDTIAGHMDFDKLYRQFQQVSLPVYKKGWFKWGIAVVVVAAGLAIAWPLISESTQSETVNTIVAKNQPPAEESPCIHPPVAGLEQDPDTYHILAFHDTVILTPRGNRVFLPAFACGNADFELRIREFDAKTEMFLSGIPMDYDSAGNHYAFESAGMIEIFAFRNGEPVAMEKGKNMRVVLNSVDPSRKFNVYWLDTLKREWVYEGKDDVKPLSHAAHTSPNTHTSFTEDVNNTSEQPANKKPNNVEEECRKVIRSQVHVIDSLYTQRPVEPVKAATDAYYFDLKFSEKKFPEMKSFRGAHFQVMKECTFFNESFYRTKWQTISIAEITRGRKYSIHVEKNENGKTIKYDIPVIPVYEGAAYDSASRAFARSYALYEQQLQEARNLLDQSKERLKQYLEKAKNTSASTNRNNNSLIDINPVNVYAANSTGYVNPEWKVTRTFQANRFGVWNCDHPREYPMGQKYLVAATDHAGNNLSENTLYVCDYNRNAVFNYSKRERSKVGLGSSGKFILWVVDKDEQLHYATVTMDGNDALKTHKLFLQMKTLARIPDNPVELSKILGI